MMTTFLRRAMLAALLCCSVFGSYAQAARTNVLVVVNDNSIESPQLGEHYAQARDIDRSRIVHVRAPNQFFITWTEFLSLRDQILRFGICPSVALSLRPAACSDESQPIYTEANIAALTSATPIRYVVLTRGVPTRMTVDGSTLLNPTEPTSVDNYLRFWLARHFTTDVVLNFNERGQALNIQSLGEWRRTFRLINTPVDREYIVGRIDGVNLSAAKALVDRTLAAERTGVFGKMYTNQDQIYPWRWAHGLLGEERPECADDTQSSHYLNQPYNVASGKAPTHCRVKVVRSNATALNEPMPGQASSRAPIVDRAAVYFGHLDDQTAAGGFGTLLNWRKNDWCSSTLCSNSADPAACRAQSTDPYREIDTECVGVEPGFLGFNFQSYPLAQPLAAWPTGWETPTTWINDAPLVDAARGADDSYSAWFASPEQIAAPLCYPYANGILTTAPTACRASVRAGMQQSLSVAGIAPAAPQPIAISLRTLAENLSAPVQARVALIYYFRAPLSGLCPGGTTPSPSTNPTQCIYSATNSFTIDNGASWATRSFTVVPPALTDSPGIDRLVLQVFSNPHTGRVGFDALSAINAANVELVTNGSFSGGHRQGSQGDYATNFLSRMGGIAFWGSTSHHQSNGWSFHNNSVRTLAFLARGLPLGDAVWLGENRNSGVLYGDPLYMPTVIRMHPLTDPESRMSGQTLVRGLSVYGRAAGLSRTVRLDVCRGGDLYTSTTVRGAFDCDRTGSWRPLGEQTGTVVGNSFSILPSAADFPAYGDYTLRLQVASADPRSGEVHTLNDYYPVKYRYSDAELAAYSIRGRVLSEAGEPLPAVSLTASGTSSAGLPISRIATSTHAGNFEFPNLPAGSYSLSNSYRECTLVPSVSMPVSLEGASVQVDLRCAAAGGGMLTGRVTNADGLGLAGMLVVATSADESVARSTGTGASGFYQFGGLSAADYTVSATGSGWTFISQTATVTTSAPASANLRGELMAGVASGYVVDRSGVPVAGAYVSGWDRAYTQRISTYTNANGLFQIGGLNAAEYVVSITAAGFAPLPAATLVPNAAPASWVLSPLANRSVMGYVFKASKPAASATLTLLDATGVTISTITSSASGFYRFGNLANGSYRMQARTSDGYAYPERAVVINGNNVLNQDFVAN